MGKHYTDPKVLLTNVTKDGVLYRDHLWVELGNAIKKFRPKRNSYSVSIEFEAKEFEYLSIGGTKNGLKAIRSIREIKTK